LGRPCGNARLQELQGSQTKEKQRQDTCTVLIIKTKHFTKEIYNEYIFFNDGKKGT